MERSEAEDQRQRLIKSQLARFEPTDGPAPHLRPGGGQGAGCYDQRQDVGWWMKRGQSGRSGLVDPAERRSVELSRRRQPAPSNSKPVANADPVELLKVASDFEIRYGHDAGAER
jgi:hypothetical protein